MSEVTEIVDNDQVIEAIKEIDQVIMKSLNARNQFCQLLESNQKKDKKRDYKLEQEFMSAASQYELFPGTAYAIWPVIMEFARDL
jgi:hypothetical protein